MHTNLDEISLRRYQLSNASNLNYLTTNNHNDGLYNLPLKQIQNSKINKYKQNLNKLFEQLQINPSKQFNKKKYHYQQKDNRTQRNDIYIPEKQQFQFNKFKAEPIKYQESYEFYKHNQIDNPKNKKSYQNMPLQRKEDKIDRETYLQTLKFRANQLSQTFRELSQKKSIFQKQLEMHSQKNLLKQQQIFLLTKNLINLNQKSKKLSSDLKQKSLKCQNLENQHHNIHKSFRSDVKQLKKQQKWLQQENLEIKNIEEKYQSLKNLINQLDNQQQKQEKSLFQYRKQIEKNIKMKSYIQELKDKLDTLDEEQNLLSQEMSTLASHEKQLKSLQQKFQHETQKLFSHQQNLNSQITTKKQYISQKDDLDNFIKQLQLQMGSISQRKIFLNQDIRQINTKIARKNEIIVNLQQKYNKRRYSNEDLKQYKSEEVPHFVRSRNKSQGDKRKLNTIREQHSKNTSAYQSPRQEEMADSQNDDLHIHSRQHVYKSQVLKPFQIQSSQQKLKKYLVLESQDDSKSRFNSSFLQKSYKINGHEKRPSIQHRVDKGQQRLSNSNQRSSPEKSKRQKQFNEQIDEKAKIESLISEYQQIRSNSRFDGTFSAFYTGE